MILVNRFSYKLLGNPNSKNLMEIIAAWELRGEILEHYGDVLFKLDNKKKAITFWKKAKVTGKLPKVGVTLSNKNIKKICRWASIDG
ncbi:hypothetical protein N9K77_01555 [bacterium]|nr:hypothetical protein [bacterium]